MITKYYYSQNLNAKRLYEVYQTRYPEVKAYLKSEISFVRSGLCSTDHVLELGAGYGRIMKELASSCKSIYGIDISQDNVTFGQEYLQEVPNAKLIAMDAHKIEPEAFEVPLQSVLCLQNALSSMKVEPFSYVHKMMTLLSPGGRAWISTYNPKFWPHRLAWFQEQAEKGLLGEIDTELTKDGTIACKDGFESLSHSPEQLAEIGKASSYPFDVQEVDGSSVFLVITKKQ